jgi:hypothetical protein
MASNNNSNVINRNAAQRTIYESYLGERPKIVPMQTSGTPGIKLPLLKDIQYIETGEPDRKIYKIIRMDTSAETAIVKPLDRTEKTWGSEEIMPIESVKTASKIICSQTGGRRKTRCRIVKRRKHRTARRKSGK